MQKPCWFVHAALILFCAAASTSLAGQSTKVELSGMVRDPSGLPVAEATVTLINKGTQSELSTATGTDGMYHFFALQPATYAITVAKPGFASLRLEGIVLGVGDQISLDLALEIGNVTESINVTAAAPLLQSTRGT